MKKYLKLSFDIVINSEENEMTPTSFLALKNYAVNSPLEFLKSNLMNIKNITADLHSTPIEEKPVLQNDLPTQIAIILLTWELEVSASEKMFVGKSLHIDSIAMNKFVDSLIPHETNDAVPQTRYSILRSDWINTTNMDLINHLRNVKTIKYTPTDKLPQF